MACIALATLLQRRAVYDSALIMSFETLLCMGATLTVGWFQRRQLRSRPSNPQHVGGATALLLLVAVAAPWIINVFAKRNGYGNGMEIVMLGTLAWSGVTCALLGKQSRTISLSVVCSGFVSLFATLISDVATALWFAYAWVALCMWWLVCNHWESLESRAADHVVRSFSLRWSYIALGVVVFALSTFAIGNRLPVWRKLHAELVPTSGGTTGKDTSARKGIGNGDALIAAKNHATSFGAVETNMFLDSEKPSLFDVLSDEFGELRAIRKVEQAQALAPQEVQSEPGRISEANRSSSKSEFGIERKSNERKPPAGDLVSNALFFWKGAAHVHLGVERFNRFDGVTWTAQQNEATTTFSSTRTPHPEGFDLEGQKWFCAPGNKFASSLSPYCGTVAEAAKFTRYASAAIPSRCGTKLWSIDQINRADFFQYDATDCLSMPGREQVPDYTVVRFINGELNLEKLERLLQHCAPGEGHVACEPQCEDRLDALARRYAGETSRGWPQVRSVIQGLRKDFQHKRGTDAQVKRSALEQFLQERAGPSYLFATSAALMLDHLGYQTRLVTGFYVNSKHYIAADDEFAVQPGDVHVWLELNAGHGYWIPLEPTPGFHAPRYTASIWYHVLQARWQIASCSVALLVSIILSYFLRAKLFDFFCWCCSPALSLFSDRQRVRLTACMLDVRLKLLGKRRPRSAVLRKHLSDSVHLPERLTATVRTVLDASDGLLFGNRTALSSEQRKSIQDLWKELTVALMREDHKVENA